MYKIVRKLTLTIMPAMLIISCNNAGGQPSTAIGNNVLPQQYILNKWAKQNNLVGAAISINGSPYFYGYSNKRLKIKVTPKTMFGIGSITKTFVSVMVLKLEAKEEINLSDKVTKFIPKYSKLRNVTIKQLLQMTSGFNDVIPFGAQGPLREVQAAYAKYDAYNAGVWKYSNASYQLLGFIIEKVTKKSISSNLSTLITFPLELKHTYIPTSLASQDFLEYQNDKPATVNFSNYFTAGGMVSSAQDLNVFISHLFVLKDIIPKKQFTELTTFVHIPSKYYPATHNKAMQEMQFGLGIFRQTLLGYGEIFTYPGVLPGGFTSAYTVVGNHVIISQSNTYNHNDFTLLWPFKKFTLSLIKVAITKKIDCRDISK